MTAQRELATRFHGLHDASAPLALPNAWDVATARLVAVAGAAAVATTSAGVAWSLGAADGERLDRDRALDVVARIAAAVDVPVSADVEGGFADSADGVGETVRGVLAAGAVGINIEDADHTGGSPLRPIAEQAERISAARHSADAEGIPLFVNARIDTYLRSVGDPATRLQSTLDRGRAYVEAGASGIFVPGVVDSETVAALVDGIDVPLNIMAGPGAPAVAELARLGVARISLGSAIAQAAYTLVRRAAEELLAKGTYESIADAAGFAEINSLLLSPPR